MAELPSPFTCDVCGVVKRDQNHWFRVWINEYEGSVEGKPYRSQTICISNWEGATPASRAEEFHCCGEEHAIRKAAELLAGLTSTAHPPK